MYKFRDFRLMFVVIPILLSSSAVAAPVVLPVDGLDTADVNYTSYAADVGGGFSGIADASSLGAGGGGDHFDDAFGVSVNGTAYSVTGGDLTGNTLTLDTASIGQFDIQVTMRSDGPVMRQIVTATNNGAAGVASIRWHNNTGNDSSQMTIGTSDGDLTAEATDRWIVTADSTTGTDNEVNSWVLFGPDNPLVTPTSIALDDGDPSTGTYGPGEFGSFGQQGLTALFDLNLAAGETRSLMWFVGIEGINQDGLDLAAQFNDTSSDFFQGLISDLSPAQRAQIANFDLAVPEPASVAIWSLLGLTLAGCGYYRIKRKK